jgi:putative hydrolase of the HAD superfamily
MAEIRGVICDFGGVLTTPLMDAFLTFQDEIGVSIEAFGEAMRALADEDGDIPLYKLERGEISEAEFSDQIADGLEPILGHRPQIHRFSEVMFAGLQPNRPMIELMEELKASGRRMAMLTNNVKEWEPRWRPMLPVDEIFETVVDSGFVGHRKPEPAIYEMTLEEIGLPAENCLFVDDLEPNIDAARTLGINAVHFRDNEQAIAEIRAAVG